MIRASAPGKVVLWGEYAVLAGAPALVMAVDRRAVCELEAGDGAWRVSASGHPAPDEVVSREQCLAPNPPAPGSVRHLPWHVLQVMDAASLPAGGTLRLDTRGFQDDAGNKLGLGSSAALCVAVYGAFCHLLRQPADYGTAMRVHRHLQGGGGSGIDVAAAWHGGTLRFQLTPGPDEPVDAAAAWELPPELYVRFVFSGAPSATTDHLRRWQRWLGAGAGPELAELRAASTALFDTADVLTALDRYTDALRGLDAAAELGVFSAPHLRLGELAAEAGAIYKPCGAGGGDIGAAFTTDAAAAARFTQLALDDGFVPLDLRAAPRGLRVDD